MPPHAGSSPPSPIPTSLSRRPTQHQASRLNHRDEGFLLGADHPANGVLFPRRSTAMLQTLVDLGLTDDWQHMIDSTTVRGHVSAVGGKGGLLRRLLVDHAAALREIGRAWCRERVCQYV